MVAVMATAALVVVAGGAASPAPIGKRGCETRCGDVSVPYPFGFGQDRCSAAPGFKLNSVHGNTTDMSSGGAGTRLLLGDHGDFEVKEISVKNRTIRGLSRPVFINATINNTGHSTVRSMGFGDNRWQYFLPPTSTELVVTGCNVQVTLLFTSPSSTYGYTTGCCSHCNSSGVLTADDVRNNYMVGYCTTPVFWYLASYDVELKRVDGSSAINDNLPVYAFIAEEGWFGPHRAADLMNLGAERSVYGSKANKDDHLLAPLVLGWACPNDGTCNASVSANTNCSTPFEGAQYVCGCNPGYKGNPYLTDGCQDIDECKHAKDHGCFGLIIGLLVSLVPSLMLLVIGGLLIIRKLEHHRAEKLKRKFFNQNHGQLLQQLVSQRSDIGERMIITMKEIEKATNNFDQSRKLGGRGHGTVYKGILSDLHVVAIKKSNIMVQREIDEFINEVAILSQINHRNIVKLHGCCLETEVPLLAYEFISNGTLGDHLHNDSPKSISWGDRLRIGCEVGRAIAYLHSAVSVPVIHRDIKSSNILLDDAFMAKLSDFGASRYIPIDQSGRTATAVQGTIGYLDPMYYYAGRLSEKSDVYSFGILLLELFTRKIPIMYRTSEGDGLVAQFVELLDEGKLVDILDSQIVEEGGSEVEEVAALAASCIKLRGEERPTMRQVEMALEGIQANKQLVLNDLTGEQNEENDSISTSLSLEEVS
ncbi:wall-associated receptor kinase 3-like [Triticum dicoccoides]|uniref:wall-associated receptor kinase 3-like n=1 Tax=Triticum dicoccoides TaxID=85692 RepID=UPI00189182F8|nr:wall-associated receptor kinase 3-like [Triticum dicoccoides]